MVVAAVVHQDPLEILLGRSDAGDGAGGTVLDQAADTDPAIVSNGVVVF